MAGEQNVGSIVYEVSADIAPLLQGAEKAKAGFDKIEDSATSASQGIEKLDKSSAVAGASLDELTGYVKSIDASMKAVRPSIASTSESLGGLRESASEANASLQSIDKSTSQASGSLSELNASSKSIDASLKQINTNLSALTMAMQTARNATGSASAEFNNAERVVESLSQQVQQLDKAQETASNGAKSLTTQIESVASAGQNASRQVSNAAEKITTVKNSADVAAKSTGNFKSAFQQAGYQVQDFIVQVQGGQSALVAFSQQGSQLAGAFGPGGAVIGAVIALSTVVAGTLVASLGNGKSAVDALKDAIETTDKVISISQNGVGALSEKYAALARVNIQVATLMRQQAEIELQAALGKVSTEVQKASKDFIGFGDSLVSSLGGGYASVKLFNDYLSTLSITTNDFGEAMKQAAAAGRAGQTTMQSMVATVGALASKFDLTDQQAYEFAKQLSDIAKNPSDQKLQSLIRTLQEVGNGQSSGAKTAREYAARLLEIATTSADASTRLKALKEMTDSLTSSQDKALRQAQQELFITRQTGDEKLKAQAWRDAENQGIKEGTKAFRDYYNVRLQTYQQQEANTKASKESAKATRESASAAKSAEKAEESIAQKLANLRAASDLTTESIEKRRIEEAGLRAEQSLGNKASQQQLAEAKALGEANEKAAISIQRRKEAEQGYKQVQGAASPVAAVDNSFQKQMEQLNQYATLYPQKIAEVEAVRSSIEEQYRQQRLAAMWDEFAQQNAATMAAAAAFDSLAGNASNALTGILTGSMSVNEALSSLGRTILNSVINSFVQMGVEYAKNLILQQTLGSAAIAATSAQAAAAAAAWATPAALAATATLGGAAVAGSTALASTVAGAQAIALAGARKNGGPVSAGSMYRVGEGGMPEIYQASTGRQYMIPGDNGRVISNKDMQAGNGMNVVVNFNDYSSGSHTYDYQATQEGNTLTVEAFIADVSNGGRMSQAISNYHNAPRRAVGG